MQYPGHEVSRKKVALCYPTTVPNSGTTFQFCFNGKKISLFCFFSFENEEVSQKKHFNFPPFHDIDISESFVELSGGVVQPNPKKRNRVKASRASKNKIKIALDSPFMQDETHTEELFDEVTNHI